MAKQSSIAKADYLAKRELRREKQRYLNLIRAQKMHKARIDQTALSSKSAIKISNKRFPKINVGCSGWFYWHCRGLFYKDELPTSQWFAHYAKTFKTVELNAPFYSWPTLGTIKSWQKQAGSGKFVYTVKVCELITHIKRFNRTKELVKDFGYIADLLGSRMGCFLFQLPPSFHYTEHRLRKIIEQVDARHRNVIEFRHRSWWNEKVFAAFRKAKIIFCSCSAPRLPDDLVKTAQDIYIRFHGTKKWYRHNYTNEELKVWAAKIRKSGAKRVWIYFNNDRDGFAIKNAKALRKILSSS